MKLETLILSICSILLICSCQSSGKGTPPPEPPDPNEVDTVTGLEISDIYLESWGDCEDNDWDYQPPVHNAYYQVDGDWENVELHGYLRKTIPYVYLDVQTWTQNDEEFTLNTAIDLSEEINYLFCNSCVKYFDECDDVTTGSQECEKVYWATEGTLTVSARDEEIGGAFEGTLTDVVFREIQMPLSSAEGEIEFVDGGQEICIKEYTFEETIEEFF